MNKNDNFLKGLWKENPVLVSMLGLCPTLAITVSVENALGMGMAFMFVLVMSNIIISLIKGIVPSEIRIPIFIVIIATLVTIVEMVMGAYLPALYKSLGIFIPLIVVNCIILGRAEAYASKNNTINSIMDALGMALGFTFVLVVLSFIREFLAYGTVTAWKNWQLNFNAWFGRADNPFAFFTNFFTSPASAFIVLGFLLALANFINTKRKEVK